MTKVFTIRALIFFSFAENIFTMTELEIIQKLDAVLGVTFQTGKQEQMYYQVKGKYAYYKLDANKNVAKIVLYNLYMPKLNDFFCEFQHCESFTALHCEIEQLPLNMGHMTMLRNLNLGFNKLTELPESLVNCEKLENLLLVNNNFTVVPILISEFPFLKIVSLESNKIYSYPEFLNDIISTVRINLMRNLITEVPESVLHSRLPLKRFLMNKPGIFLAGNELVSPPLALLKFSRGSLPLYFKLDKSKRQIGRFQLITLQISGYFLQFFKRK